MPGQVTTHKKKDEFHKAEQIKHKNLIETHAKSRELDSIGSYHLCVEISRRHSTHVKVRQKQNLKVSPV